MFDINQMIYFLFNSSFLNFVIKTIQCHYQELADKETLHKQEINNIKEQNRQLLANSEEDKANKLKVIEDKYQKEN